jgi:hypothetical protein
MIKTHLQVVYGLKHAMDILPFGMFRYTFQAIDNISLRTIPIRRVCPLTLNQPDNQ